MEEIKHVVITKCILCGSNLEKENIQNKFCNEVCFKNYNLRESEKPHECLLCKYLN